MPNERISMSKLKQLIALQTSNLGVRALARALGLSIGAVSKYLRAVRASGIEVAEAETLSEAEVEERVFGQRGDTRRSRSCASGQFPSVNCDGDRRDGVLDQIR